MHHATRAIWMTVVRDKPAEDSVGKRTLATRDIRERWRPCMPRRHAYTHPGGPHSLSCLKVGYKIANSQACTSARRIQGGDSRKGGAPAGVAVWPPCPEGPRIAGFIRDRRQPPRATNDETACLKGVLLSCIQCGFAQRVVLEHPLGTLLGTAYGLRLC